MTYTFRLAVLLTAVLIFAFALPAFSEWEKIEVPNNSEALDTIWGTSDNDIYTIGFTGHIFHKGDGDFVEITDEVLGDRSINITLYSKNDVEDYPFTCIPFGLGGNEDYAFVTGVTVRTEYLASGSTTPWADAMYLGDPFVYSLKLNPEIGEEAVWTEIPIDRDILPVKFFPHVIVGITGNLDQGMYFSGWMAIRTHAAVDENDVNEYAYTGIILHYDFDTGEWTGEVGRGDLADDPETSEIEQLPEINEITMVGTDDVYAVGLKGLILHKSISQDTWSLMETRSDSLNLFRIWGNTVDNIYAVGHDISSYSAIIYHYDGESWTSIAAPTLKQGKVPSLWGIWGNSEGSVHAVGNSGASIYYDMNPASQWYYMITGTTTSLNCVWGTSFDSVYATGEDGNVYHFNGIITTSGAGAYPLLSVAPSEIQFSDISPGEVSKWEWDFNDTVHEPVAPTADLDYKILITAVEDESLNGTRIVVLDDEAASEPYLEDREALSAQCDLGNKLLVTAVSGKEANNTHISVQEIQTTGGTGISQEPEIYHYKTEIVIKVLPGVTTQAEVAALLEGLDLIRSAVPDTPGEFWFAASGSEVTEATLAGGKNVTIRVMIDSGFTTFGDIASLLTTHRWIDSAVADNPTGKWVRGLETTSNSVEFSGGTPDSNLYVNDDPTIDKAYMAWHTYTQPGTYTARVRVTCPQVVSTGEVVVYAQYMPEELEETYDQRMYIAAIPGVTMNNVVVTIDDGGDGCIPAMTYTDETVTVTVDSGTTLQSDVAALLLKHPYILAAIPNYSEEPWYVSDKVLSNTSTLFGGTEPKQMESTVTVRVLDKVPVDFTITPAEGVGSVTPTFTTVTEDFLEGRIVKWTWYFDWEDALNTGSVEEGSIVTTTNPRKVITYKYNEIGSYNVRLKVLLDDNSPFILFKKDAIVVRSPDENKSSLEGGSGLSDISAGCFVESLLD